MQPGSAAALLQGGGDRDHPIDLSWAKLVRIWVPAAAVEGAVEVDPDAALSGAVSGEPFPACGPWLPAQVSATASAHASYSQIHRRSVSWLTELS